MSPRRVIPGSARRTGWAVLVATLLVSLATLTLALVLIRQGAGFQRTAAAAGGATFLFAPFAAWLAMRAEHLRRRRRRSDALIAPAQVSATPVTRASRSAPTVSRPPQRPQPPAPPAEAIQAPGMESRELRASRQIQEALLPRVIPIPSGYHIEVDYRPCGALGGDFYDFLDGPAGTIYFTLGDVSGKGPPGAIVMAMVQTLFRQNAKSATGPADLLRRVNDGFAGTLGKGVFATVMVGQLQPDSSRLTLAAAGHHPALLLNPSRRRAGPVEARGHALGLLGGAAFADSLREKTVDLVMDDSLLVYTDGATDCVADLARDVGQSRFLAAAAASVLPGPRGSLDRLARDLWEGGGRRDDTTMLLLSKLPEIPDVQPVSDRTINGITI